MLNQDTTLEILQGGCYTGSRLWDKKSSEIDKCFKIYYITDGQLILRDAGNQYILQNKGLYLICGFNLTAQKCHTSFSTQWLHFIPKSLFILSRLLTMPTVTEFHPGNHPALLSAIENINDVLNIRDRASGLSAKEMRLQGSLQLIVAELLERYPQSQETQNETIQRLQPAINQIKEHYTTHLKLEDLAALCHISPNHFHKLFTSTFNTTPNNYMILLRMNKASSLIRETNLSIKEISYQLGFSNDTYFSRAFKKYYNTTPGAYRNEYRNILY